MNENLVYLVKCYQNVLGVFACDVDAFNKMRESIALNRPASVECYPVIPKKDSKQK